jgi:hypothetical protein
MKANVLRLYRRWVYAGQDIERLEGAIDDLGPILRKLKPSLYEVRAHQDLYEQALSLKESLASRLDLAMADHAALEAKLARALLRTGPVVIKAMRLTGSVLDGYATISIEVAEGSEVVS